MFQPERSSFQPGTEPPRAPGQLEPRLRGAERGRAGEGEGGRFTRGRCSECEAAGLAVRAGGEGGRETVEHVSTSFQTGAQIRKCAD